MKKIFYPQDEPLDRKALIFDVPEGVNFVEIEKIDRTSNWWAKDTDGNDWWLLGDKWELANPTSD